ncbi:MAG TPA: hypothetical protein VEC57_17770 [Candidatus Limnocylindrales bacterium]|nr:hypothetical protein [Candidatus Limnocylindrales bacterium]
MSSRLTAAAFAGCFLSVLLRPAASTAFCEDTDSFCIEHADVCNDLGTPRCHAQITRDGLAFMRPHLLSRTVSTNLHMDHEHIDTLWSHMDGCDWESAADNINGIYSSSVDHNYFQGVCVPGHCTLPHEDLWGITGLFNPSNPRPADAAAVLGYALHPIQDFYSHSNWVEIFRGWSDSRVPPGTDLSSAQPWNPFNDTPPPLMDPTVDVFRVRRWQPLAVDARFLAARYPHPLENFVVLTEEDGFSDDWHTTSPYEQPYNIPMILPEGIDARYIGVISGSTHGSAFQEEECPAEMSQTHTNLNKDSTRMTIQYHGGVPDDHYAAAEFATRQTAHEWCRLLHLARRVWGFAGVSIPMAYWVRESTADSGAGSPHPPGTPCEATPAGTVEVTVDVDSIKVLDDHDDGDNPGDLNFVLVVYTHDLTRSAREEVTALTVHSGAVVGDDSAPGPVSLCLTPEQADAAVATLQAWDDDDGPVGELNPDGDQALLGVHVEISRFALGSHAVTSPDMEVAFDIGHTGIDADGDGLTTCRELALGTAADDADSDDDGLGDGEEVDVHQSNPLDADSDDDGVSDGDEIHTHGSDPNDADSDDDGLSDGDETSIHGTDPTDSDSDDDDLDDGLEVELGTGALDEDSDDDGLFDGHDVEFVQAFLAGLPGDAFKNRGSRRSLLHRLDGIERTLLHGDEASSLATLASLQRKLDGCGPDADNNDGIHDCALQLQARALVELLAANVRG